MIISIFAVFPKLVQAGSPDNQSWVNFDSVGPKRRIFEELFEWFKISFKSHIREIRHHVTDYFIGAILGDGKGFFHSLNGVPSVCISCNVFVNALHSYFKTSASVGKHISKMSFTTEIRPSFNGDSYTFSFALLRKLDCFPMVGRNVATESIMQITNEIVSIFLIQGHESPPHYNEFHLIDVVTYFLQLLHSVASLDVRVIPGPDSSHGSWLIPCVRLRGVFKVGVRPTWTVDADISGGGNVRTSVWFAHNRDNSDTACSPNRLGFKQRCEFIFIVFGDRADDLHKFGGSGHFVFPGGLADELMQIHFIPFLIALDEDGYYFWNIFQVKDIEINLFFLLFIIVSLSARVCVWAFGRSWFSLYHLNFIMLIGISFIKLSKIENSNHFEEACGCDFILFDGHFPCGKSHLQPDSPLFSPVLPPIYW